MRLIASSDITGSSDIIIIIGDEPRREGGVRTPWATCSVMPKHLSRKEKRKARPMKEEEDEDKVNLEAYRNGEPER